MHFWQYKWGDCATFFGKVYVLILHKFAIVYFKGRIENGTYWTVNQTRA